MNGTGEMNRDGDRLRQSGQPAERVDAV